MFRPAFLLVLLAMLLAVSGSGEIIPNNRRATWEGSVGVPGGIPARATVFLTISPSLGNGVTDAWPDINGAVNNVPSNQVVQLPDGVFRISQAIRPYPANKKNYTIRGNGPGRTVIKCDANTAFAMGTADFPYPTTQNAQRITKGATAGSNNVTVASTAAFVVGNLCHVAQDTLPYVIGTDNQPQTITFKVISKTATTVTLSHALPCDFTNNPVIVPYPTSPMEGVGIENLTIDCQDSATSGISMEQAYGCWVKNVEIIHSFNRQMLLTVFNQGEIRHCYVHDTYTSFGPNHEGIDFYNRGCWNLIEDNIVDNGGFPGIVLGDSHGGCTGNVIAHNFCINAATGTDTAGADISFNHGAHNSFNLAEGNVVGNGISSDGYFGSASHNTIFRNWAWAKPYNSGGRPNPVIARTGLRAIQLNRMSNYYNVVGNILGDPAFPLVPGNGGGNYTSETANYPEKQLIYELGFPNLGNKAYTTIRPATNPPSYLPPEGYIADANAYQQLDLNVKNTILRHGNYDFFTKSQIWDPTISDRAVRTSYFATTKPSWFGALAWPAFDATRASTLDSMMIPAQFRYLHRIDPPLQVRSRKVHGAAGTFDIDLPLSGTPGVECRSGGSTGDYKIVTTFTTPITWASAVLTAGFGSIKDNRGTATVEGANVTVELENVSSGQAIEIEINGMTADGTPFDIDVPMTVLVGDVTGNGAINSSDVSLTKSQAGRAVTVSNFREDVTASGSVNASDIALVKSRSGTSTP
jgi:hypothetical protein